MADIGPVALTETPVDLGASTRLDMTADTAYDIENVGGHIVYYRLSTTAVSVFRRDARSIPPGGHRQITIPTGETLYAWADGHGSVIGEEA